ncbi:MAG: hypothetical protein GF405_04975 [Candidatus Eisenbacteria bacterium]|nr:hypothetical protein [Candidatus Eisenbacteria bacterium]
MTRRYIALLAGALCAMPLTAGCMGSGPPLVVGELVTRTEAVPRTGVTMLDVTVELGIGEIAIGGGAEAALDAEFRYNVAEWKPVFEKTERGDVTSVTISQPDTESGNIGSDVEYSWKIDLPDDIPCRLELDVGVGESVIDLAGVDIDELSIDAGVGSVDLSLRGVSSDDLTVAIDGGVGEIHVHVPEEQGVRVKGDTGIGEFRAAGLRTSGSYLVNDAYERNGKGIEITINAGIGEIVVDTKEQGKARA